MFKRDSQESLFCCYDEYMKTVLLVPGFKEDLNTRDYRSTIKAIQESGYSVKFIPINWHKTTINNWLNELEIEYSKHDPKGTILAGFSFGALTAFTAATKQNPHELWLFSLSPYFNEDIHSKNMRKSWLNHIGHRRVSEFEKLHFQDLAKRIKCRTIIFAGSKELNKWPGMEHRAVNAKKLIENSSLVIAEGVEHDVSDRLYIETIKRSI